MEVHKQYDLRSKGNLDDPKKKNTSSTVRKNAENQPKKTAEKLNVLAKKPEVNKEKNNQPDIEKSTPSTLASGPSKTVLSNSPNKVHQIRSAERNPNDKIDVNMTKSIVPFSLEGEIAKINITIPLAELVTQEVYKKQF